MAKSAFAIAADLIHDPEDSWMPQQHQIPPAGDWFGWLLLGGRGAGKTAAAARYMYDHVTGPPCLRGVPGGHWPSIIAPTLGDAVTSCVNGPSGLRSHDPGVKVSQTVGGTIVKFSNGTEAKLFGASTPEDIERLRSGGNRCMAWLEELAAFRYIDDAFQHMRYGLRVGPRPHWVASTTPKPKTLIKNLVLQSRNAANTPIEERIVITRATTDDNPHLPDHIRKMLYKDYGGTRLGRQELYAEILEDIEGALWTPAMIDGNRLNVYEQIPEKFDKIAIGVDPPAKANRDECGIIVAGVVNRYQSHNWHGLKHRLILPHAFVLADHSLQGSPDEWASAVLEAYDEHKANIVIAEINNGGDMVKANLRTKRQDLPVKEVHATRGKARRAEPVVGLYEQERVHHCGVLPLLEDQMTSWDATDPPEDWSPDRMDGLVWVLWYLLVGRNQSQNHKKAGDKRLRGRR